MSMVPSIRRLPVWQVVACYAVMTAIVLYPVCSVQIPGLGDYLNHLARMHILADMDRSESLKNFYQVQWQAIPYLVMDAAFVALDQVATIYDAGRIFIGVCILLPVLSVAMLHFAVYRRLSLVPAAAFLFCYNGLLSWGFLNYLPALCLAVLLFAGWIGSAGWKRWPRAALFSVLALALYLGHLVAFAVYCLMVGSFELGRAWRIGFRPWRGVAADWSAAALQAVPAIVLALNVVVERPFVGAVPTHYGNLTLKLYALVSPVWFYNDASNNMLLAVFVLFVLAFGLLTARMRLSSAILPAILAVGGVAVCMPNMLLGTFGMDVRLPLLVVLLLIGATSTTERMGRVLGGAVLGGMLVLSTLRSADIATALREVDGQISEVRQVVAAMPRGMRVLVVDTSLPRLSIVPPWATWHVAMVAVIDRDAFVPYLFTGLGTVRPVPALRDSSTPNGNAISLADLADGVGRRDGPAGAAADGTGKRIYWLGWADKFDYVLIEHFGNRPAMLPANLRQVASSSVADLYRIDKTPD